jgi:hypothetical protein
MDHEGEIREGMLSISFVFHWPLPAVAPGTLKAGQEFFASQRESTET